MTSPDLFPSSSLDSQPPALERQRQRLDKLQTDYDAIQAQKSQTKNLLIWVTLDCMAFAHSSDLEETRKDVTELERQALAR